MNDHIVELNEQAHRTAQELLPWYAMNKLEGEELAQISAHLQTCAQCRSDLEWERRMLGAEPESDASFDMELALGKLMPKLDAPRRLPLRERLSRLVRGTDRAGSPKMQWMPWALAAQSAAIVALVALLALPDRDAASYHTYRTLGASRNTTGNAVVVFEPGTSEHDMRQMLTANSARIMDGPTVTDAYLLSVPPDRLESSLRMLRAERGVKLAEPLVSGEKR